VKRETATERDDTASWNRIAAIVDAPGFAFPWLDRFYEEGDVALLEALADGETRGADLIDTVDGLALARLRRAHRRGVVTMDDEHDTTSTVAVAPFWDRFEYWITFEGWRDIPEGERAAFADGYLERYIVTVGAAVADVAAGRPVREPTGNDYFILLAEAEGLVRGARRAFVRPCICRRIYERCDKPVDVCIWFDNDERDVGWEISRERALELLHVADRAGLMFTADTPQPGEAAWICCCCSDCCEPLLAAEKLGAADVWPLRRFVADVERETCTLCGACVKRCPFDAWALEGRGKDRVLRLTAEECRGCGVCATGCPESAIAMEPR
jgi:Pyruvate/2-oxoacid:ferredoxin oxidoreductase delta subunit